MLVTVSCTTGTAVLAVVAKQTGFMCKHVSASPEMVTWSCIARKALSSDHRHRDAQLPTFKQAALAAIGRKHLCLNRVNCSSFRHAVTNLLPKLQSSPAEGSAIPDHVHGQTSQAEGSAIPDHVQGQTRMLDVRVLRTLDISQLYVNYIRKLLEFIRP